MAQWVIGSLVTNVSIRNRLMTPPGSVVKFPNAKNQFRLGNIHVYLFALVNTLYRYFYRSHLEERKVRIIK